MNAATNSAYIGPVNIAAFCINPEAADLNSIMPGDLRGVDNEGIYDYCKHSAWRQWN